MIFLYLQLFYRRKYCRLKQLNEQFLLRWSTSRWMPALIVNVSSAGCTNELWGEDLCIRQVAGHDSKTVIDLKSLVLTSWMDLMGFSDSLDGYERAMVCSSCLFSSVMSTSVSCVSVQSVLCILTWYSVTSVFLVVLYVGSRQVYVKCSKSQLKARHPNSWQL